VKKIMEIPRKNRKQIFVTGVVVYYTNDLATAKFGDADAWRKSRATPSAGGEQSDEYGEYEYEMMMEMEAGMGRGMYAPGFLPGGQTAETKKQGFVVTVVGYTPYGSSITEVGELLDPHGVENQREKWGFVTRLANLDALAPDGNSPFTLYEKADPEQFSLEIQEITLDAGVPDGVGEWKDVTPVTATNVPRSVTDTVWVLVDPMTQEVINKVPELNENGKPRIYQGKEVYKVNDHWFVMNAKFIWKDAPPPPATQSMFPFGGPSPSPSRPPSSSSSSSGGRNSLPDDM